MKETVQTALFDISRLNVESGLQRRIIESLHSSNGHLWTEVRHLEKANKALEEHNKTLEAAGTQLVRRMNLIEKVMVSTRPFSYSANPQDMLTC